MNCSSSTSRARILPPERVAAVLAAAVAAGDVVPVLPVCAVSGVGVRTLLNELARLLPSPLGREHELADGSCTTDPSGPLVVHVFKTAADPFVGQADVHEGAERGAHAGRESLQPGARTNERLGHLFIQRGQGADRDAAAGRRRHRVAAKLAETMTGDTLLGSDAQASACPALPFPEATFPAPRSTRRRRPTSTRSSRPSSGWSSRIRRSRSSETRIRARR